MTPTVPDGPDTELAAAATYFRLRGMPGDAGRWSANDKLYAATIVRAVLARPAAGRDLTAQDVRDSYVLLLEQGVPTDEERQFIADHLNRIARPAVARTDVPTNVAGAERPANGSAPGLGASAPTDGQAPADAASRIAPEAPAGSVRWREGWRIGWEQRGIDDQRAAAPADDTAAPDARPTTVTVSLPTNEHDIDGEDAEGRWTQNPAWETRGIESGLITAWAEGVSIEDVLHDEGDVLELEEAAHKVLAAVAWHRHYARAAAARPVRDGGEPK